MHKVIKCLSLLTVIILLSVPIYAEDRNVTVTGTVELSAATDPDDPDNPGNPDDPDNGDDVTTIDVTIPTLMTFIIDEERNFISPDYSIRNNGDTSVKLSAVSLFADTNTSAKVVANDKYTDDEWKTLSISDTTSQIALGLKDSLETHWFAAEPTYSNLSLGNVSSSSMYNFTLDGKYGYAWDNTENLILDYKMTVLLEAE